MSQTIQNIVIAVVAGVVAAMVVLHFAPSNTVIQQVSGSSPAGSSFTTQKQLGVVMNLANGTTTSVYNGSTNDQYILGFNYACTGVGTSKTAYTGAGLSTLTIKAATTTSSLSGSTAASNVAANANLSIPSSVISTSTTVTTVSSTTVQSTSASFIIVPAGSYLTFITNATNTAVCSFVAETLSS